MSLQQKITYKKNISRIGKIYPILVEDTNFGHTEFQCPEIDGKTYCNTSLSPQIVNVKIKKLLTPYDFFAEIVS